MDVGFDNLNVEIEESLFLDWVGLVQLVDLEPSLKT